MHTIAAVREKIKRWGRVLERQDIFVALLVVLVGFASFGLGRLSAREAAKMPLRILQGNNESDVSGGIPTGQGSAATFPASGGRVVASKSGTKYHLPWCSGASQIKEENKIWFDSSEAAAAAGYAPAANCKGL